MADNYLEKKYEEFQAKKTSSAKRKQVLFIKCEEFS